MKGNGITITFLHQFYVPATNFHAVMGTGNQRNPTASNQKRVGS